MRIEIVRQRQSLKSKKLKSYILDNFATVSLFTLVNAYKALKFSPNRTELNASLVIAIDFPLRSKSQTFFRVLVKYFLRIEAKPDLNPLFLCF